MTRFYLGFFLIVMITSCSTTQVKLISVGETLDVTQLENQHGESFENPSDLELLLFVNGMTARSVVRASIDNIDLQCLVEERVAYVADISGMPSIISNFVAVPRMRDYHYPVWLDYDGEITEQLPVVEENVSVIDIDQGKVTNITYITDISLLTKRLSKVCGK